MTEPTSIAGLALRTSLTRTPQVVTSEQSHAGVVKKKDSEKSSVLARADATRNVFDAR